jgi:hypothetical protein
MNTFKEYIRASFTSLATDGYMVIDLVKLQYFSLDEIVDMQKMCMNDYYDYFIDRGISEDELLIDLNKEMSENKYFKQPRDSNMFKAMYGNTTKDGKEYINTRSPANATNCGMGSATSQRKTYFNTKMNVYRERLRPLMRALYGSPVKRHLSRFGIKLPPSKDMQLHTDMSYIREYKDLAPPPRDPDDAVAYHSFSNDGKAQRYQMIIALNDSDSGWYGYPGAHLKYDEIGDILEWPGKTRTVQVISPKVMKDVGLSRVDIPSKIGQAVIWNCGIPHGNTKCCKIPRLTLYVNYQPDKTDTVADTIIGLGNQPKGGMND